MSDNKNIILTVLLAILLPLIGNAADTLSVHIVGDKLSVEANQVPLQVVLKELSTAGVLIRIDPKLNPTVSASFQNKDTQAGLAILLKSVNHVLIWETVQSAEGRIPRLAEIQVFEPGQKSRIRALVKTKGLLIATHPSDGSQYVQDEILVRLKPGSPLSELKRILRQLGGTTVGWDPRTGTYRIRLPQNSEIPSVVEQVAALPGIAGVEPNYAYPLFSPLLSGDPSDIPEIISNPADAERKVAVAVLDSGLSVESGVEDLVVASLDTLNPEQPISDNLGHGTQMAMIAAGVIKPHGVSTEAGSNTPIIPIRIFDENGYTSNYHIMQSINFALSNGARVLSLSWGTETPSDFLKETITDADARGLILVASAGNKPTGKPTYPAAYESVIGAGALGPDGTPWKKSNYGESVKVYAPGFGTFPVGYKGEPGDYAGTSISAAFVANMIADYLTKHPGATKQQTLEALGIVK